jgi:hypothetical protein
MTRYFLDIATSGKNCTNRELLVMFLMLVVATIHSQSEGPKVQKRIVFITELSHHLVAPSLEISRMRYWHATAFA